MHQFNLYTRQKFRYDSRRIFILPYQISKSITVFITSSIRIPKHHYSFFSSYLHQHPYIFVRIYSTKITIFFNYKQCFINNQFHQNNTLTFITYYHYHTIIINTYVYSCLLSTSSPYIRYFFNALFPMFQIFYLLVFAPVFHGFFFSFPFRSDC